ncbi:beta-lactamase [Candidatus Francisella endociliophora]|uniref:beta-lactamase n=1 Tax=Candidatus Francisella endociliophora TaxID=653937 RepID=A0A097ELS9_9GAMM|nr:class A beta-lactamase [Francisella sp. FSC1006]AIT08525.1 beta-lactamase [Francisella sp. FSC1006]
MKKIITTIIAITTISPLFATSKANIHTSNEIKKIEKEYGGKIGVYTINRNDWKNFSHNASFYFPTCSTYKFLVVGAILKQSMKNKELLSEKIKIVDNQIVGYSPITKKHSNKEMTIRQLCKASINNDNTATNLLIHKLGGLKELRKFTLSLQDHATKVADLAPKISKVDLTTNLNKTTPKIMARDINKLAFSNDVLDDRHQALFKKWLRESTSGDNRIAAEIPEDWTIGDKTGTCEYGTTNDVAIIWPDDSKPIAMSIFYTQPEKSAEPNSKVLRKVTEILFDNLKLDDSSKDA